MRLDGPSLAFLGLVVDFPMFFSVLFLSDVARLKEEWIEEIKPATNKPRTTPTPCEPHQNEERKREKKVFPSLIHYLFSFRHRNL